MIAKKKKFRKIVLKKRTQHIFTKFYTKEDISLIAEVGNMYRGQNGYALKKVFSDMYNMYEDFEFERLSYISVSHIYNLKKTNVYKKHSLIYTKTNPVSVKIGERVKPAPRGIPGYLRVDSVYPRDVEKTQGG